MHSARRAEVPTPATLRQICDWPDQELGVDDKLAFFRVTRHTFGRTALLLSGGGGLGIFHLVGAWWAWYAAEALLSS